MEDASVLFREYLVRNALREAFKNSGVAADARNGFADVFVELVSEERPQGPEQVIRLVSNTVGMELKMSRDETSSQLEERIVDELMRCGAMDDINKTFVSQRPVVEGDRGFVYLDVTGEWHRGTVEKVLEPQGDKQTYRCVLDNFGGDFEVTREQLSMDWELSSNGDEGLTDGDCVMCERNTRLTAHHLRPKEMHNRYIKKGFTRQELAQTIMVCRPCHSAIHRAKTNAQLAESFYTLELIMQIEDVQNFVNYVKKVPVRLKNA